MANPLALLRSLEDRIKKNPEVLLTEEEISDCLVIVKSLWDLYSYQFSKYKKSPQLLSNCIPDYWRRHPVWAYYIQTPFLLEFFNGPQTPEGLKIESDYFEAYDKVIIDEVKNRHPRRHLRKFFRETTLVLAAFHKDCVFVLEGSKEKLLSLLILMVMLSWQSRYGRKRFSSPYVDSQGFSWGYYRYKLHNTQTDSIPVENAERTWINNHNILNQFEFVLLRDQLQGSSLEELPDYALKKIVDTPSKEETGLSTDFKESSKDNVHGWMEKYKGNVKNPNYIKLNNTKNK